jgi:hypothetical protein
MTKPLASSAQLLTSPQSPASTYHAFLVFRSQDLFSTQGLRSETFRKILRLVQNSEDMKFADAESIERICARFGKKRSDAADLAHLRRTRSIGNSNSHVICSQGVRTAAAEFLKVAEG